MIKKTFSIKMKEDLGTSKPKKDANKVWKLLTKEVNIVPNIKQITSL